MECGSACPPVCGEERPMLCAAMCVRECQCPPGLFLDRSLPACVDTCSTGGYSQLLLYNMHHPLTFISQ